MKINWEIKDNMFLKSIAQWNKSYVFEKINKLAEYDKEKES